MKYTCQSPNEPTARRTVTDDIKVSGTNCLKVPDDFGAISSAEEDSSDSLSDPVAKKRDIVEGTF